MSARNLSVHRLTFDVIVLFSVAAAGIFVKFGLTPYKRGYFCSDETIRLDYHSSTVPSWVMYLIGTLIVTALVRLTLILSIVVSL
jgi:hypothetical protein